MSEGTNLSKLQDAGIVGEDHGLSDEEQESLEKLPGDDVDAAIRVHQKMSGAGEGSRPRALGII